MKNNKRGFAQTSICKKALSRRGGGGGGFLQGPNPFVQGTSTAYCRDHKHCDFCVNGILAAVFMLDVFSAELGTLQIVNRFTVLPTDSLCTKPVQLTRSEVYRNRDSTVYVCYTYTHTQVFYVTDHTSWDILNNLFTNIFQMWIIFIEKKSVINIIHISFINIIHIWKI